jgi:hypothetical protein
MRQLFLLTGLMLVAFAARALSGQYEIYFPVNVVLACDSDSMSVNRSAAVIRFDNRLYQMGLQIGTFDRKTSISKGQLTTRIQIYNLEGKTIAEALSQGINASFVVNIYPSQERFSLSPELDHEVEEIAGRLRVMGKL